MTDPHNSPLVITHYFLGVSAFLCFALAFVAPKGGTLHRLSGKLFLLLYTILILSGMVAGIKYKFYPDPSITLMLWAQAAYAISLLVQGLSAPRYQVFQSSVRMANLLISGLSLVFAFAIVAYGGWYQQSISCSLGVVFTILSAKNFWYYYQASATRYPWKFFHASAMVTAGLLLTFNGSGFYGVHDLMDRFVIVSWGRVWLSYGFLLAMLSIADVYLYLKYFKVQNNQP